MHDVVMYSVGPVLKAQALRTYSVSMANYTCTPKGNDIDFPCPFSTISKWRNLFLPGAGAKFVINETENGLPSTTILRRGDMSNSRNCQSTRIYWPKSAVSSRVPMIQE
jgi:hypothetical protein